MADMNRRGFLGFLASLPIVGKAIATPVSPAPIPTINREGSIQARKGITFPACARCGGSRQIISRDLPEPISWMAESGISPSRGSYSVKPCPDCPPACKTCNGSGIVEKTDPAWMKCNVAGEIHYVPMYGGTTTLHPCPACKPEA